MNPLIEYAKLWGDDFAAWLPLSHPDFIETYKNRLTILVYFKMEKLFKEYQAAAHAQANVSPLCDNAITYELF